MLDLPLWSWAPLLGVAYFAISWRTDNLFPFSRYAMYSSAVKRQTGAVPAFLADGAPARLDGYTGFTGLDPERLYPSGIPCSLEWKVHEAARYIATHRAEGPPGPIEVVWGFWILSVDDGVLTERLEVIQRGRAHRRTR